MVGNTVSHYRILEKLGEGGMGVVYKAEDTKLKRTVALKFLPSHLTKNDTDKARFLHEAQVAAVLNHNNVCTIHEIHDEGENPFIVMEYVEGKTLRDIIASIGAKHSGDDIGKSDRIRPGNASPLKILDVIDYSIQIAEALKAAHKKSIVHRDIKSENIMVTETGQVKVMDFGLAKLAGPSQLTKTGTTLGTVSYMSPEQARGEEVDHRTDIWSLGVILYEMLTGQLPFKGEYEQAVIYSILNENPEQITSSRSDIHKSLNKVVKKALEKDPGKRYPNAGSLIKDLKSSGKISSKLPSEEESIPSIAVLPFRDMSPQKDQDYFCEGMAEELINALTHIKGMKVAARTSAFQFKAVDLDVRRIGEELGVKTILEGSVRKAGNRLRITAQLVKAEDGYHLWSEKYDRDLEDIFAIQDEISLKIVENLKVTLLEKDKAKLLRRYTEDQEAYDLYLKGRYFWNRRYEGGLQKAIEYFNQTIKKDTSHAPAYSGIADSLSILGLFWLRPRDVFPRAKSAAQKAIEIDETLAEGHASLGWILFMYDWDWTAAERKFKRAIELDPRYALNHMWYAVFLSQMGRVEEAMVHSKRALGLEPVSLIINACSALVLWTNRQYGEAIKQGVKAVEMDPNFLLSYWYLSLGYNSKGMWKECISALEKTVVLSGDSPFFLGAIGHAYAKSGQKKKAQEILCRLKELSKTKYNSPINEALIFLGLDEKDQMFEYLEKAYNERSFMIPSLKVAPAYDSVRQDPRYLELLKKIGLDK
ncbi:MAG: protein kinase [Thermodesulfovibrionales bacterium]|nr:protein kinase [Thermodesulfovibrionales bacterium]